jgi:hypothetical protein
MQVTPEVLFTYTFIIGKGVLKGYADSNKFICLQIWNYAADSLCR